VCHLISVLAASPSRSAPGSRTIGSDAIDAAKGRSPSSVYTSAVNWMLRCRMMRCVTAMGTCDAASIVAREFLRQCTTTLRPRLSV